jgi:hypothetical protein
MPLQMLGCAPRGLHCFSWPWRAVRAVALAMSAWSEGARASFAACAASAEGPRLTLREASGETRNCELIQTQNGRQDSRGTA